MHTSTSPTVNTSKGFICIGCFMGRKRETGFFSEGWVTNILNTVCFWAIRPIFFVYSELWRLFELKMLKD